MPPWTHFGPQQHYLYAGSSVYMIAEKARKSSMILASSRQYDYVPSRSAYTP